MEKRRNFTGYASVTLADGNSLTLTENEFTLDNNSVTESAGSSGLPLGEAICRTAQIEIINPNDKYSNYDFVGAKINLELRFWLDGKTESFDIGKFTVVDPATYGETIIITALDDMRKADKNYNTDLAFPATAKNVLADICSRCEITLATTSFTNDSFVIQNRPSGNYHFRTVIGYIAMIASGNAKINRSGALEIMSYDFTALEDLAVRGGTFSPWTSGDTLSGGTLNPWTTGDTTAGGDFVGRANYHLLKNFKNLKVDTDEIEITGVSMTVENDMGVQDLISGIEGYVLNIDNPLLAGKEEEGLALIASVLVGGKMRKFEGDHIAYPLAEFMDPCLVIDGKGNMYPSILTDIDFEFFGFTKFKNSAASKEALKSKASSKYQHELIKVEKKAENLVEAEKTAREEAITNLNNSLADSSGMYTSDVKQSDGSTIRYLHDKPSLAESKNVIKITSEAIGISNDGGATYPYGFTLNGKTITKYLYAEGIDADYITVGRISDASDQNYWDLETGEIKFIKGIIGESEEKGFKVNSTSLTSEQIELSAYNDLNGAYLRCKNSPQFKNYEVFYYATGPIFRRATDQKTLGSLRLQKRFSASEDESKKPLSCLSLLLGYYNEDTGENGNTIEMFGDTGEIRVLGDTMNDFVVEQGVSGIWSYIKWKSGRAEMYGKIPINNVAIDTEHGAFFKSSVVVFESGSYAYPVALTANPTVNMNFATTNGSPAIVRFNNNGYASSPPMCHLLSATRVDSTSGYINISVQGKWK